MSFVELTPQAEQSVLEILRRRGSGEPLLFVDMMGADVQLTVRDAAELVQLQRDVDIVGPFRVPIGGQELSLFVRDGGTGGCYELDSCTGGNGGSFQIRERSLPRG